MKYKEEHMLRTFNSPYLPNHFHSIVVYSPILLSTLGALGFFLASLLIPDGWREVVTARNNELRKTLEALSKRERSLSDDRYVESGPLSQGIVFPVTWSSCKLFAFKNFLKRITIGKTTSHRQGLSSICVHDIYLLSIAWSATLASSFISSRSCLLG